MGNRFRMIVNEVESVEPSGACRSCRSPAPSGNASPTSRPPAPPGSTPGGAHHTGYSYSVTTEMMEDFAAMAGVELAIIDGDTKLRDFKQNLRLNDLYYVLAQGLRA